jgi:hypothetical protein
MDSEYLQQNVADALSKGLASACAYKPDDPVAHLGNFLLKYVDNAEKALKAEIDGQQAAADAEAAAKAAAALAEEVAAAKAVLDEQAGSDAALFEDLTVKDFERDQADFPAEQVMGSGDDIENEIKSLLSRTLSCTKYNTGASSVYIGKKVAVSDEKEIVRYICATEDNTFMVGQTLESSEEAPRVTFDVFIPEEVEEPPEPEEGEEPVEVPPPQPKTVHVENVLSNDQIKYFRFPKLGAYLCAAVTYQSSIHSGAIPDGAFDEPEAPEEPEEPEGGWTEENPKPEPEAPPRPVANTKEMQMIIALDSMGQARKFKGEEIQFAKDMAAALAKGLERASAAQFQAELANRKVGMAGNAAMLEGVEEREAALAAALEEFVANQEAAIAAAAEAAAGEEGEEAAAAPEVYEEDKALEVAEHKYGAAAAAAAEAKDQMRQENKYLIAPAEAVLTVKQTALKMLGYDVDNMVDGATGTISWSTVKSIPLDGFFEKMDAVTGDSFDAEAIEGFRAAVADADVASEASSKRLLAWVTAALDRAEAKIASDAAAAQRAEEAAAAAAEAARIAEEEAAAAAEAAAAEAAEAEGEAE